MFAIGVKLYPFHNGICSVRIAIARMCPMEAKEIEKLNKQVQLQSEAKKEDTAKKAS